MRNAGSHAKSRLQPLIETTTISARVRRSLRERCTTDQKIQHTCGIPAPDMARPGLEPGTPRFSVRHAHVP
jgi:hypothetical protein